MRTPWGNSQDEQVILAGVLTAVSTASHGGFFVHKDYRTDVRPSPTLNSTTWFEEDCDWAVAWLDLHDVLSTNKSELRSYYRDNFDQITDQAKGYIETYFPDLPEMNTCYDCGYKSTDKGEFTLINIEKPSSDYPGYEGDLACWSCVGKQ